MLGALYERALQGERCWIRWDDGDVAILPVRQWIGGGDEDSGFDRSAVEMCSGATIELGCGPGRLIDRLTARGLPAVGVDQSITAVMLAQRRGAAVVRGDVFGPLPGMQCWQTVLLVDGTVGLGGDPARILSRAADLLIPGGRCVTEFDPLITGIRVGRVRLECGEVIGPWFHWARAGLDSAHRLAEQTGMAITETRRLGPRAIVLLRKPSRT